MKKLQQQFAHDVQALTGQAEGVIREVVGSIPPAPAANDAPVEGKPKAKRDSSPIRDIHIHTGGDKGVEVAKPRGPRKFRFRDTEDGAMEAEEILEQIQAAAE